MMDSNDTDYDMLDLLAWNCTNLMCQLNESESTDTEQSILEKYLKRVDGEFDTITDFKDDLDWFNVSEPLSLKKSLSGKIVVLDFFTYCCINCMHILPDLKRLEHRFGIEDGLVVVGVHSAKFDNEKDSANILSAVQRYDITHPVVNDSQSSLWMDLHIKCWPTLLILGPRGNPLFVLMGEGHSATLEKYVQAAIEFYDQNGSLQKHLLPLSLAADLVPASNLKFPGKIACSHSGNSSGSSGSGVSSDSDTDQVDFVADTKAVLYAISDSGNHRVLVINEDGVVIAKIGGKKSGFVDGDFSEARFNSPQGVTFYSATVIYVADTENHAIREINLTTRTVVTIAGHGKQGNDQSGGLIGTAQEISSPWDLVRFRTRDMDMSFHMDEEAIPERDIVLVAMAGTHQIWAIFKDETIWWKFKKFPAGAVAAIAGNGHEENRNNSYPQNAAFAQPSGVALSMKHKELYIVDSESSCIRKLALTDGKVSPIVGGDRNPLNLFAFGDADGVQFNAKLQHPLGIAYNAKGHCLYVADTYNHKIKKIDLATSKATSCHFHNPESSPFEFNEPGGLCLSPCNSQLYVCDTNNHSIVVVDLDTSIVTPLKLQFNVGTDVDEKSSTKKGADQQITLTETLKIQPTGAKIRLEFILKTESDIKFTANAPQKWQMSVPNEQWQSERSSGAIQKVSSDGDTVGDDSTARTFVVNVTAPSIHNSQTEQKLIIAFKTNMCASAKEMCFPKPFSVLVPILYTLDGMDAIDDHVNILIGEKTISVN